MNKVVLITGGAKRIGKSICEKFHKNDFSIICHYNSSDKEANELKEKLNAIRKNSIELIKFDLNDVKNYQSFCEEALNKYGKVDVVLDDGGHTNYQQIKTFSLF